MLEALKKAYENREPPFTSTELAEKVSQQPHTRGIAPLWPAP